MENGRQTKQKQVILLELRKLTGHPTAAELYSIVREVLPQISLGTLYRNLELLSLSGVIRKLGGAGRKARFDPDTSEHQHLHCMRCGRLDDIEVSAKSRIDISSVPHNGWKIDHRRLDFVGLCPACREQKNIEEIKN